MRFLSDDRKVDPKAAQMQVLCLGLSRCATSSLQAALESDVLGMAPCMHMAHIAPHPDREQLTIDAANEEDVEKRQKLLHKVFDGYASACDFPGWVFAADLMDMYPDAVIVLNQRKSAEVWAESIGNSLQFFGTQWYYWPTFWWKTDRLHYGIHQAVYAWSKRKFGDVYLYSPRFYELYNEWVREEARKRGREVLEWQVSEGWGPLCEFVGKEAPKDKRAFPHLNDAKQLVLIKRILITRGLVSWAAVFGAAWATWTYGPEMLQKAWSFVQ
ncbi:hypothetical protein NM208_g8624 [Fusarium decemcellulare]|uniref:Uncharacterized protein n=1 Tax=Fusarium decemcellulare TaxID=57161 RepID=A0ACC1S4K2_9HYPO|nr:hypothetical protein NM208_g8624 [Fusarium decemcellulare]